jgi:hypothetical protein
MKFHNYNTKVNVTSEMKSEHDRIVGMINKVFPIDQVGMKLREAGHSDVDFDKCMCRHHEGRF